jgi:membrane protein implicated in regulation of membrane protease activity
MKINEECLVDWFIPEWLVALSLTLFVLDIFLMTEFLSWGGVLSLSTWLVWKIDAPIKWSVLIFVVAFTGFSFLYGFLFRNTIVVAIRKILQGKSPEEGLYSLVGKKGEVRKIEGNYFISVEDELWPIRNEGIDFTEGVIKSIVSINDGVVSVE